MYLKILFIVDHKNINVINDSFSSFWNVGEKYAEAHTSEAFIASNAISSYRLGAVA